MPNSFNENSAKGSYEFKWTTAMMAINIMMLISVIPLERLSAEDASKSDLQAVKETVALQFRCRVVDKEADRGISNARVHVRLAVNDASGYRIFEESDYVSDAEGQYTLIIPAELAANPSLVIERDIEHPDYAVLKGAVFQLALVRNNDAPQSRSLLEKAELFLAEAVMGTVVSPDGKPLSAILVKAYSKASGEGFLQASYNDCVTDAEGRFRLNLHKDGDAILWIIPKDFAASEKFIAKKRGDLGEIKLIEGVRVNGQVLGIEGNPLQSVAVQIDIAGRRNIGTLRVLSIMKRAAVTDAEGRFVLDPLPPGDYAIQPAEFLIDPQKRERKKYEVPDVFIRQKITIKETTGTQPVTIQALPHVIVSGQLFDSKGEKLAGANFVVGGQFDRTSWSKSTLTNQDGVFSVCAPHGLRRTSIEFVSNDKQAWRYRRGKDEPFQNRLSRDIESGTLTDDVEGFEVVCYKSPEVVISAVDEEQKPIPEFQVVAMYPGGQQRLMLPNGLRTDLYFEALSGGRARTQQMIPDEKVTFKLTASGFEPASKTLKLAEGETQELVVTMKKQSVENSNVESGKK